MHPPNLEAQTKCITPTISIVFRVQAEFTQNLQFTVSHEAVIKVLAGNTNLLRAQPGKDPFPSSLMWLLAEFGFMELLKASVPYWQLAEGHPCFLFPWASPKAIHSMAACFVRWCNERRARERENKIEVIAFCNLSSEVTSYYSYYSLFIRCQYVHPTPRGKEWHNCMDIKSWRSLWVILLSRLPTTKYHFII